MAETHVKYVIEIKKVVRVETVEKENLVKKETPTDILEYDSGSSKRFGVAKEYQVVDVTKAAIVERSLYRQEAESLDVRNVIEAVQEAAAATRRAQSA